MPLSARATRSVCGLALAMFCILAPARAAEPAPGTIKALFLGDNGHHQPADRAAQLIPVMAGRGIEIDYTDRLADLNPENLARYDVLLIYANTTQIEPREEQALLDYVAGGRGLPIPTTLANNSLKFRQPPG